jgi:hypothetical protein
MKIRWISLAILLSLIGAACAPTQGNDISSSTPSNNEMPDSSPQSTRVDPTAIPSLLPGTPSVPTQEDTPEIESSTPSTGTPSPAAQGMVRLSVEDLSRKLNIEPDQISVVEVIPVVWRDASLGCPKPAIDYIRVETPGYSIVLEAGGQVYNYHTDEARRVMLCND